MIFSLWDATTFRPGWDFFRILTPENREEIGRYQEDSRSTPVDWLFAFAFVELMGLGFVFGTQLGLDLRLSVCRLIADAPLAIVACPPALRWSRWPSRGQAVASRPARSILTRRSPQGRVAPNDR